MRQRRWMEFLKDYDFELQYHPGKANVVADALSRKVLHASTMMMHEMNLLEKFRDLNLNVRRKRDRLVLSSTVIACGLRDEIRAAQMLDWELQNKKHRPEFTLSGDGVILVHGKVYVPNDIDLREKILDEAHKSSFTVHPGSGKMYHDLRQDYWWPGMKDHICEYVSKCYVCQRTKAEHQKPSGLLVPLEIPEWKWDSVAMDFVVGLPRTSRGFDSVWVVVDRLTKTAHFLPVKSTYKVSQLAKVYLTEIVKLHGVPQSIVSDRDPKFTSRFWRALQTALGTQLTMSSAYHPQTDGQSERTIQTLEDMLRACVIEDGGSWDEYLHLVEFAYNNSYHSSIGMAPYEALYGRRCRTPLCWQEMGDAQRFGPDLVQWTTDKIRVIQDKLKTAQSRQKSYADHRRKPLEFDVGDHVFVKVTPTVGIGRALKVKKLHSRFIGPFEILARVGPVAYQIALPPSLSNLHSVFHVSQLKKYIPDPFRPLDFETVQVREDLTYQPIPVQIIDRTVKRLRNREITMVKVLWSDATVEEATWEAEDELKEMFPHMF